jgi:hypothetical protein
MAVRAHGVVGEAVLAVISAIVVVMGCCVAMDALNSFYTAYSRAALRLEDESWLRENCKDPVFFNNMRAHTTVCTDVEANARIGAFWIAMHNVTDTFRVAWQPWAMGAAAASLLSLLAFYACASCVLGGVCRARRLVVGDTRCDSESYGFHGGDEGGLRHRRKVLP